MRADALLDDLRNSRTDLARLVEKVRETRRTSVVVSTGAIDAWRSREPQSWPKVRAWLEAEGIAVEVI